MCVYFGINIDLFRMIWSMVFYVLSTYDSVYFVSGNLVPVVIEGPTIEKKLFGLSIVCKKG